MINQPINDGITQPLQPIELDQLDQAKTDLLVVLTTEATALARRVLKSNLAIGVALGVGAGAILRGWEFFLHSGTHFQAAVGAIVIAVFLWYFLSPDRS